MKKRTRVCLGLFSSLLLGGLSCSVGGAQETQTLFYTGFEYAQSEPLYGLLEAVDLNGAQGQVGLWSGDDFPAAAADGFFAGGVIGGDSAGFVEHPHGGNLLFIDRTLDTAVQFANLRQSIPNRGAQFSVHTGLAREATADYDFFGLDADGDKSFHIRVSGAADNRRLGYVKDNEAFFDLPTGSGTDQVGDLGSFGLPPLGDGVAELAVNLLDDGYTVNFKGASNSGSYSTALLPYDGSATSLARVGVAYRGEEDDAADQSSFYLDEFRVTTGTPIDPPPSGEFSAFLDPLTRKIVLEGKGQNILGIEIVSEEGLLVPSATRDPKPFGALLANTPNQVAVGSLVGEITIDGTVATDFGYAGSDPENELQAFWGDEDLNLFSFKVKNPPAVSGFVNAEGKLVVVGTGQDMLGLDFRSEAGLLTAAEGAEPFEFLLSNFNERVTYASVRQGPVKVDGQLTLSAGYLGTDPENDLIASWGDALGNSFEFDVRLLGGVLPLDCNGDGVVDGRDLECICASGQQEALLNVLGLLPGDFDQDGKVDFPDFLRVAGNFEKQTDKYTDGDADCDGTVGFSDFLIVAVNFGKSAEASAVPEPSSQALLLVVLASLGMLRRRR